MACEMRNGILVKARSIRRLQDALGATDDH